MRALAGLLMLMVLIAISCSRSAQETPPLPKEAMISLLMEVYLSEARTNLLQVPRDSSYRLFLARQDSLMHERGISDSTLRAAHTYYLNHPAELESVYDAIIDSLSLREQRKR